jgi:hypothetical protein
MPSIFSKAFAKRGCRNGNRPVCSCLCQMECARWLRVGHTSPRKGGAPEKNEVSPLLAAISAMMGMAQPISKRRPLQR